MLTNDKGILNRWKRYFEKCLNEKFSSEEVDQFEINFGVGNLIREGKVWRVVRKMKNRKVVGPDRISVKPWKVLGRLGVDWLTKFFNKLLVGGKIPNAWRKSYVIHLFKGKGDVHEFGNYRRIKLMSHTKRKSY
ncbi:PREDICTED: uncharacterized protein LOC107168940 [Diuraphis noxia]|uniref:uncharacterized protein LOC107168940 n=1 Tax=Diuraphis noxia TaxID=143948 RepID=UPI0007635639|nr:PREDICTED: uncharacterized protein LOC107168940 [Diuraphis noxia]